VGSSFSACPGTGKWEYTALIMKVAILEDLKEVALELCELLDATPGMSCSQVYFNAEDAMHFLPQQPADVLLVDIGLPRASGIEAIEYLAETCPAMQYCMFTVYEDDDKIFQSLKVGARGYILKGSPPQKIVEALQELQAGGSPMSPSIARRVLEELQRHVPSVDNRELPLNPREKELLTMLSQGMLYKEIAVQMGTTIGTVKQSIHRIYGKLHVTNRTEAINRLKR